LTADEWKSFKRSQQNIKAAHPNITKNHHDRFENQITHVLSLTGRNNALENMIMVDQHVNAHRLNNQSIKLG